MELNVHGQNFTVTEHIEEYAKKKLGKLNRYLPNISEVDLELTRDNTKRGEDLTIAQITLRHSRGAVLRAQEKIRGENHDAAQKAINAASEKMYRQIERFKGKRVDRKRRGQSSKELNRYYATEEEISMAEPVPNYEEIAAEQESAAEAQNGMAPNIVRRKDVALAPMTEEEAIEQMELLGHTFFMFLNADTTEINVVYARAGGGYGILIPKETA